MAAVFAEDGTSSASLAGWARDHGLDPALRISAARRLEELRAPEVVPVASDLAREPAGLVRDNAVAILVRLRADDVIATLGPDARALARARATTRRGVR
jgi:hypothetical protein